MLSLFKTDLDLTFSDVMSEVDAVMMSPTLKKKPAMAVPVKEGDGKRKPEMKERDKEKKVEDPKPTTTTTSKQEQQPTVPKQEQPTPVESKLKQPTPNTEIKEPPSKEQPPSPPLTIASLTEENTILQARINSLESDLQDAQDTIFSLQPRHLLLTESEATEEYTLLLAAVEEWVDQKLGDALEDMNIADDQLRVKDIGALMDLIPPAGKAAFNILNTDVDLIQAAILRYLDDTIFAQDFYCPLSMSERQFVMTVERSMRSLTPRRDIRTVRNWRIETYTAASARPGFAEYATERMWALTIDMIKMLRVFAPGTDPNSLAKSFFESITKPACNLARKMHLSLDEYTLEWSTYHDKTLVDQVGIFDKEASEKDKFATYEFIEMNSRKVLRDRPMGKTEDGKILPLKTKWMFDMSPKLVFRKLKADAWMDGKVLVRPRVLVCVCESRPGSKRGRKKEIEDTSVLGALAEWLLRQQQQQAAAAAAARSMKPAGGFLGMFQ
ncbi:uncharacterized protein BDV14DRAFT_181686 [Aspergillus stella-maris]|uniref:uncharacterized protein n=1 Tax=Aspergillus stella-maris TaxID=1810926 RepID=UPI003CCDA62C